MTPALPGSVTAALRAGTPAIVLSVGADGFGHAAMTWAAAPRDAGLGPGGGAVRFIVDWGSTTLANLRRNGRASLQIIGADDVLALIKGPAREVRPRVEAAAFPMAMWEMAVAETKDQSWGPVAVAPLAYAWRGPEAETLRRMEQAVLAELREWRGQA